MSQVEEIEKGISSQSPSAFHKTIDLAKGGQQPFTPLTPGETQATMPSSNKENVVIQNLRKNGSVSSFSSSLLKNSFFSSSSFCFGLGANTRRKATTPKVNISNIIKKRAYLYLDEQLAHTLDEILDKGYNLVLSKKNERDFLKDQKENLLGEITKEEKEIFPLLKQMMKPKKVKN